MTTGNSTGERPTQESTDVDRLAWLTLASVQGIGARRIAQLVSHFGSANAVLRASESDLSQLDGLNNRVARAVRRASPEAVDREGWRLGDGNRSLHAERAKQILGLKDGSCPIADEAIGAARCDRGDWSGDREHLPALFQCTIHRDECSAVFCSLHDDQCDGKTADQSVATRERAGKASFARRALAQQHSVLEGALEQQPVRLGVDLVYTRPEHPDCVSSGIQGGRLGDRIEAACHAAHDTYPGPGQLYGKLRRDGCTVWSVIAAADHGNAPSSSERDVPPTVEHRRRIGNRPD